MIQDFCKDESTHEHCVDLYDVKKKTEKAGTLWFTTRYRFVALSPVRKRQVDGANVSLWKGLSSAFGSID